MNPQPDPPGLPAIRRFLDRPWIHGGRAWLRYLGSGIWRSGRWLARNAGTIARGIAVAGRIGARVSRGALHTGRTASRIGRRLGPRRGGRRLDRIGGRVRSAASTAENFAEDVSDLGDTLVSLTSSAKLPPRPERTLPEDLPSPQPASATDLPPGSEPKPPEDQPHPPTGELPRSADLPPVFAERIRALGERPRAGPLRDLIVEICAGRAWTTLAELSAWLDMGAANLRRRHLSPMVEAGRLELRYPERTTHPDQAYRAK